MERAEQREEMGGVRLGVERTDLFHGYFRNSIISNGNPSNAQCAFSFMDLQRSINFPHLVRVFGLCPKRNFYQKVVFWA